MNDLVLKAYVKTTMGVEKVRGFLKSEQGVTAVEYAIVLAGVAAVVAVIFGKNGTVQDLLESIFKSVSAQVQQSIASGTTPTP
ncbi:TPA: Flp family type IVb pilin [Kluyvera ascorbata]|uniref:Flp family type IVb pilin n=1 Tax=Kluyvera ascorbata TaxID=51288 RepID=UPI00289D1C5D|nr:Flp family type IVb pilin [Kluyvera ascorbata]MEB6388168.1 Flp family type IVb pilin [Kluyvera ascorbata]HED3066753.1 Flp family type IVb pilin [Kluyvera ascorbata]